MLPSIEKTGKKLLPQADLHRDGACQPGSGVSSFDVQFELGGNAEPIRDAGPW
jgi:hypothetical protein